MAQEYMLTQEGYEKLRQELDYLKTEGRRDIAEKIKVARSFGDLSENSEYDEAMNDQGKLEARISEIEGILKNAKIVDKDAVVSGTVHLGSKVKLKDLDYNETVEFLILGENESSHGEDYISSESPVGKVLMGKKVGDKVTAEAPGGNVRFKIMSISK